MTVMVGVDTRTDAHVAAMYEQAGACREPRDSGHDGRISSTGNLGNVVRREQVGTAGYCGIGRCEGLGWSQI